MTEILLALKNDVDATSAINAKNDAEAARDAALVAQQAAEDAAALFPTPLTGNALKGIRVNALETAYEFVDLSAVTSVFGRTGAVAAAIGDYTTDQISETASNKIMTAAERTKLTGIETGATADQTGAEIKTAYEAEADTNAFTDAEKTKLAGVAASANNYVHPNHTGDVTSTGDGATVIANDVVTNLKLANMAEATLKGRAVGSGAGDPSDLSASVVRTTLNVLQSVALTQAAYDALGTPDANTVYFIIG